LLRPDDLALDLIVHSHFFHFGSVSLTTEPSRSTTLAAARRARDLGHWVSFDPNVRPDLWDSEQDARARIAEALQLAHVVKLSSDEIGLLTGIDDPVRAGRSLCDVGPSLVVVTLGSEGCAYTTAMYAGVVPAFPVEARDPTGAGDAFMAGLLAELVRTETGPVGNGFAADALIQSLRFANAAGALATTEYGAIPALPRLDQVQRLLRSQGVPRPAGARPN
jgi:fructokinase